MQTDDGWIISNSSFPIALAFSLRTYQWQCFPFSATVRDTAHPPPLWPWLNDTINPTLGLLALDQIYHNLLPKVQIQLSLTLSVKIALKFFWFLTDTLNVIKTTALSVPLSLHVRLDISYQLLKTHINSIPDILNSMTTWSCAHTELEPNLYAWRSITAHIQ